MKYLLGITYDGSAFHGWQVQPGVPSVQGALQDACEVLFKERPNVTGCSRTDSGVHAREYYCTVEGETTVPTERLPAALNTILPDEISVFSSCKVSDDFHPRYSCLGKEYTYDITTSAHRRPLDARYSWQLCRRLDTNAMNEACAHIVGTHDFASFCASGSGVEDTIRTVHSVRVCRLRDDLVRVYISADGFLYNMVRIIVGTLTEVGMGKMDSDISNIITSRDRAFAGPTAPAHGLCLNKVFYDCE